MEGNLKREKLAEMMWENIQSLKGKFWMLLEMKVLKTVRTVLTLMLLTMVTDNFRSACIAEMVNDVISDDSDKEN